MKLPGAYILNSEKGFSLIEVMLVITLFVIIMGISFPLAVDFYTNREFDIYFDNIVQTLRTAQLKSMLAENDSSFGIYFSVQQYVLFRGNSYLQRDPLYDETFELPANVSVGGITEITFSKIDGIPSDTGSIAFSSNNKTKSVSINGLGVLNY